MVAAGELVGVILNEVTLDSAPEPKVLHERAAASAKETRSTLITLSTASIGGLFVLVTRKIEPSLSWSEILLVLLTIGGMVATLASAIWFGFCDAQWSYYWGVELDPERLDMTVKNARDQKLIWHSRKSYAEWAMLSFFAVAALAGGFFVVVRVLNA